MVRDKVKPDGARLTGGPASIARAPGKATLALAAVSWVVAVDRMAGMDMGVATEVGSFPFFVAAWVSMMGAMMLPGAVPAVARRARSHRPALAVPLFVGCTSPSGRSSDSSSTRCTGRTALRSPVR
jgi:predicted metal-binding membrane protein